MSATLAFVILLVFLALVFDYINGFHDAANSIATVVSTRVLSPGMAVIWAAFFNFIAFAVFGTRVAKSIGDGVRMDVIDPELRLYVLLAALLGAIIWNLITWYLGLPTSSSHALLGGYAGAGIAAHGGISGLLKTDVWIRTLKFIVLSPMIGMLLGFTLMVLVFWIFRRSSASRVDKIFRRRLLFRWAMVATTRKRRWASSRLCLRPVAFGGWRMDQTERCRRFQPRWCSQRTRPLHWGLCPVAGASCTRWAAGSRS